PPPPARPRGGPPGGWSVPRCTAGLTRPRSGPIVTARGRDAAACAISTNFGYAHLARFDVHTDEIP
ncbi:hypothetical protein CCS92_30390, partial [Methylobacterium radiotolerans]